MVFTFKNNSNRRINFGCVAGNMVSFEPKAQLELSDKETATLNGKITPFMDSGELELIKKSDPQNIDGVTESTTKFAKNSKRSIA